MSQQHTSATPTIINGLYQWALGNLASDTTVIHVGYQVGDGDAAKPRHLFIGVDDAASMVAATSSTSTQSAKTAGPPRARDHVGVLTCAASSWNGGGDADAASASAAMLAAINDAYSLVALIENQLRVPPNGPALNLTNPDGSPVFKSLVCEFDNERLSTDQTDMGASAVVIFDIKFLARI